MAHVRLGSIVADIRGRVGDLSYSRNQGGAYVQSKPIPTTQGQPAQLEATNAIRLCSKAWSATLTESQRQAWRQYAHQFPRPAWADPAGATNGYTRFISINSYRARRWEDVPYLDPPPAGPIWPPEFTFTIQAAVDRTTVALPLPNYDPPPAAMYTYIFLGKGVSPGVNYYGSPWRFADNNKWDGTWFKDPWRPYLPWPVDVGDKVFAYLVAQLYDTGELSTKYQASAIAT